ncbi:MAG: hypothetical protein KGL39_17215 [Patescibacteria group bacterium]|nr:hypothetical protein [Patescibacteria group bacterium]
MSWLSEALHGDFSWVGGHNTLEQALGLGGLALGGVGLAGLAGLGPLAAAEGGALGAPLDLLSFGSAAGTAIPEAAGAIVPATGALASGLATEPAFAGSTLGAFAPGLDTGAAGLGAVEALGAGAGALPPGATPTAFTGGGVGTAGGPTGFDSLAIGGTPGGAAPAAPSGAAVAGPADVTAPLGVDPTAAIPELPSGAIPPAWGTLPIAGGQPAAGGDSFLGGIGKALTPDFSKPGSLIGPAIAGAGLGYNILQGQVALKGENQLSQIAGQEMKTGQTLQNYLTTGTLPPGLQASVKQATDAARARAISNMASQGMSTDPRQNTALAAELAQIDQQIPILTAQIGEQLLSSGIAASGLSSHVYTQLSKIDQTQTAAIGKAIANMAAALSGRTSVPGTNLQLSVAG